MRYVKNENIFRLKYYKPVIILTDTGFHIDFGTIPSAYFESPCEITLYFNPLRNIETTVTGGFLTKELEYYYGPRHKTDVRPLATQTVYIRKSFSPEGDPSQGFINFIKRNKIYYTTDIASGDFTKIYIPSEVKFNDAMKSFFMVVKDHKFIKTGEIQYSSWGSYTFL